MNGQTISQVARRTGFTPATLRYYEAIDLLRPTRSEAGYRRYSDDDIELLRFIGQAKRMGLSLRQIHRLADGWRHDDCRSTRAQLVASVDARLGEVRRLIDELVRFQGRLEAARDELADRPAPARCGPGCGCDVDVITVDSVTNRRFALPPAIASGPRVASAPAAPARDQRLR